MTTKEGLVGALVIPDGGASSRWIVTGEELAGELADESSAPS